MPLFLSDLCIAKHGICTGGIDLYLLGWQMRVFFVVDE
jgi:hypothetical protein